jgi:hypothetical protein
VPVQFDAAAACTAAHLPAAPSSCNTPHLDGVRQQAGNLPPRHCSSPHPIVCGFLPLLLCTQVFNQFLLPPTLGPNVTPPPGNSGDVLLPRLAPPVPFCL